MQQVLSSKRRHAQIRGRGVTAAQRAFTLPVRVQVPPAPLIAGPVAQWSEQAPYKGTTTVRLRPGQLEESKSGSRC